MAIVAGACSSGGSTEAAESISTLTPSGSQDLVVAVGPDPYQAEPNAFTELGLRVDTVNPGLFETLTAVTPSFGVTAGLARAWEMIEPELWRFQLRPEVTFHDGQPMDAAAVAESLNRMAETRRAPRGLTVTSATGTEPLTVEIRLSEPNARLAEDLANPGTGITAPGTRVGRATEPADTPTGTGPFAFASYVPGQELVTVANPDYWGGVPTLSSLTLIFGTAEDTPRLLATRTVDMAGGLPSHVLGAVSGRTDRAVLSAPARSITLLLNAGGSGEWSVLSDAEVRRAVVLTLDPAEIVDQAWPREADFNARVIAPLVLGEAAIEAGPLPQDREEAKRLLAAAGWGLDSEGQRVQGDRRLILRMVLSQPAELAPLVDPLRAQLSTVGIGLEVVDPAPEVPFDRLTQSTFDLYVDVRQQPDANPCALCRLFVLRPGGDLAYSSTVGAGAEADELWEQVNAAVSIDAARRLASELMATVVERATTAVGLGTLPTTWLAAPWVRAFSPAPTPAHQTWTEVVLVDKPGSRQGGQFTGR